MSYILMCSDIFYIMLKYRFVCVFSRLYVNCVIWIVIICLYVCLYVFICVLSHYDDVIGVGTFLHVMLHVHLVLLSHDTL